MELKDSRCPDPRGPPSPPLTSYSLGFSKQEDGRSTCTAGISDHLWGGDVQASAPSLGLVQVA